LGPLLPDVVVTGWEIVVTGCVVVVITWSFFGSPPRVTTCGCVDVVVVGTVAGLTGVLFTGVVDGLFIDDGCVIDSASLSLPCPQAIHVNMERSIMISEKYLILLVLKINRPKYRELIPAFWS
jgi:hypothetical protein